MRFAFIFFILISTLQADVKVYEVYDYYTIDVSELELLKDALDEKSPLFEDQHEYGNTLWDITWHYTTSKADGLCKINEVFIKTHFTYILPQNINNNQEEPLQKIWKTWFKSLKNHQMHHKKLTLDMAKTIEKDMLALNGYSHCTQLSVPAQNIAHKRITQLRNFQLGYDFKSKFGKEEGAHLKSYLDFILKK